MNLAHPPLTHSLRALLTSIALFLLLALPSALQAQAPDLTTTDLTTINRAWTWNLGPTGMRGWIYNAWPATMNTDDCTLFAPYQILVTTVAPSTPAAGVLAIDDVILGASAGAGAVPLFTTDARKTLGWAIGAAEASDGILSVKRWRAGVTTDVSIALPVMGVYTDTAPYSCAKSALIMANAANSIKQRIDAKGWGNDDGSAAVSALALMATGDPTYMPMVQAYARHLVPAGYVAGGDAWHFYNGVFLAEYYLLTNDAQVYPGLCEYVKYAAKNSDLCGTTGHGFATLAPPGGWVNGHHGSIAPYGALNQAGLIAQLTIVLGKKAGVTDPEIDPAIARTASFFGHYVNAGDIPYGEHQPFWGEHQVGGAARQYYEHRSNGKNGLCAVLFSCMGDKPAQAEYFARTALSSYRGEAYGHTGQGFSYLWTELAANMGGPAAAAEYEKRVRWDRDLKRRSDGSFVYEGGDQWGPGQAHDRLAADGVTTINAYWDTSYEYWMNPTACYLLHAAMPLKVLYITGKGLDPANPRLTPDKVTNATWACEFAANCGSYSKAQLIAALSEYDPIVRMNAATELGTRWVSATELNSLITMAENPADAYQRAGACTALGCLKAPSAIPALTRRLSDSDLQVRARAALALGLMDPGALASSVPDMAQAFTNNVTPPLPWDAGYNTADPLQMPNGFLAGTLFGTCANTMLNADKSLLYPAVRVGLQQPTGNCRGQLNGFVEYMLSQADVQELTLDLFQDAKVQTALDTFMGGYPPIAAMRALSRCHIQESIQVMYDNVPFYKSWALDCLPKYGEAARWTLPELYSDLANWKPSGSDYAALSADIPLLEAATSPSAVYALPHADAQILATPANTGKAITLTGSSWRTPQVVCTIATQPVHGTLTGFPPKLTYTPAAGYQGMDSFTYNATDSLTTSSPATVNLVVGTGGSGLTGSYYDNMDFTTLKTTRIDSSVNFDWGSTPPTGTGLSAGTYSVRWTGLVLAPETGTYRFSTRTSDGVRLWINGVQVINDWNDQAANLWNDSAAVTLTAGHKYEVKMEYYNNANPATARLYWYMPSRQAITATIIPQELLFPVAGVCLASPQDGARFGVQAGKATVTLTADTSGISGTVTSVSFYNGSTLIGSTTAAPYSFTWTNVPLGQYNITVQVTDSTGLVTTSPGASIAVDNYTVPVTTGLACYFDASVGITTDVNGVVQGWRDRSGNGHDATLDISVYNSGAPTLAANQLMGLPAIQMRGPATWFDVAGAFHTKEQYLVLRSPTPAWTYGGCFLGRASYDFLSVRASSYTMTSGATTFWDQPLAASKNGRPGAFNLAPITNFMVVKITLDDNASAANLAAYPYYQIGQNESGYTLDWDVAEILGYNNALSPSDEAFVGGYLAAKYGIATAYPATGSLANKAASAITTTSAAINATLLSNSNTYNVVAYWGPVDGGINPANWANSVSLGSGLNAASINLSNTLTHLNPGTTYYFNCCATNGTQTIWAAAPLSFTTTSTSKDFLTFGANVSGSSAIIDTVADTVVWTVPYGTSLTSMAPTYTVSAQAAGSPVSGTTLNFSTPQTYTLTGQDGSTKVYTVTVAADATYPASSGATLTAAEDVATALTAANFGYADPNVLALAAVQITALPLQGTLKLSGTAVANGAVVTAANIPNLTYQPVLYAYGTPYTTIGIKVMNSNNVWSIADSVMTVNVAYANHPPTSSAAAFTMKGGSFYTFWKTDFPFTDVDAGDWLTAVRVTSLPSHGTLMLAGVPITTLPGSTILAVNTSTLTYTPNTSYFGADTFNYQVSDGKTYSADAAMAITVVDPNLIPVLNGSFETPDPVLQADGSWLPWSDGNWAQAPDSWSDPAASTYARLNAQPGSGTFATAPDGKWVAIVGSGETLASPLSQDLGVSVGAGDMVSVTFSLGRGMGDAGGQMVAYFKSYLTSYPTVFDSTSLASGTWKTCTLTQTIIEPGNLSLGFYWTGGSGSWLDKVSNVTITPAAVVAEDAPTTSGGVLTAVQDTATALSTANFGYSDPNSVALGSVQIISLPALGTLKLNGSPVSSGAIVSAANLANLTYQGALNGYATPYTKIGIKVANTNNVWSSTAWLTVNVTRINHAPTSIGASVILKPNTVRTFAAGDFPFADSDTGDTLGAIKMVTTLPAHGTLSLNGTPITAIPSAVIPVANIGNLTYTPTASYLGADSFKYQVRDASLFSADATMAITVTSDITVQNGSFETTGTVTDATWAHIDSLWNPSPDSANGQSHAGAYFTNAADGTWYASFMNAGFSITQDLLSTANAGDILSVTFYLGKDNTTSGIITATLMVGSTPYSQNFDTTSQVVGTWAPYTLTATLANAGNLSLQFSSVSGRVWLDKISKISVTPTNAPNSTHATLTATEDIATPLAAGNFGYADPNSAALAAVQITSLPALGTLMLNGSPVSGGTLPLTVAAANIGNLTYQSALYGFGTPYTTFGIMVQNTNGLWSIGVATMTVNVTHVNHAPTSTGGLAVLASGSVKTFAAGDFQFSDVDTGDVLTAIKITSLPAHGTLNLNGTPITSVPIAAIPVASIPTLTYTPTGSYSGADSFNYQVSDGTVFSADATMAVTVNYAKYIAVQNGSFETPDPVMVNGAWVPWSDGNWAFIPSPWVANTGGYGRIKYSSAGGVPLLAGGGTWMANMTDAGYDVFTQDLGSQSFNAGDTLSVTFYVCRDNYGSGVLQASFLVGSNTYSQTFDTTSQAVNTWQSYTLTQAIPASVTANLTLKFSNVSGRAGWLDNISNVSVMGSSGSSPVITLTDALVAVNTTYGTASATPTSFHVAGSALTGNLTVTPPSGYEVSLSSGSGYTNSLTLTASGTLASTQVFVRLAATAGVGSSPYVGNITVAGGGASSKTLATASSTVSKATPVVVVTPYTVSYDSNPHTATVTSITGVSGETGATVGSVTLITTHTTAGTYATDSWSLTGTANYNNIASTTLTDTINKATPTATLAVANSPVTYDGTSHAATVTLMTSSVTGAVQNVLTGGSATQTAAGTYAVTANFVPTDTANYNSLTAIAAGNFTINPIPGTIVGTATATASGQTGITVTMPYTGDSNANNSYKVEYKYSSGIAWTTWVANAAHTASPYSTTITGLTAGTSYDVRVTYQDIDGVTGTNPQTLTAVSTLSPGITELSGWSNLYHNTATTQQNLPYSVPAGSGSNRVLVVAISSAQTAVGARTVALTYGGQTLTLVNGDMATATVRQHTALYCLNNAGLIAAAANANPSTLAVTVSGGTTRMTDVFAAVYDGVDQTTPVADSKTYSSVTTAVSTFVFSTGLVINAGNQAVGITCSDHNANTTLRTVSTYPANWALVTEQTSTATDAIRNFITKRSIPVTSLASDISSTAMNNTSLGSMSALSLTKAKVAPSVMAVSSPVIYNGSAQAATVNGSVAGTVSNVKYNGSATVPTAVGTYAVTADFVPSDSANYNTLTGFSAGNFVIAAASYASWAAANGATGGVSGYSNNAGVPNGVAYFMGVIGPVSNPVPDTGRKVTWTNGGNIPSSDYSTQFVVQTSPDLVTWSPVAGSDPNLSNTANSVSFTLPPGAGRLFVRLVVTPN